VHHYGWLDRTTEASSGSFKVNLELLVRQLKDINSILAEYGQQIETLAKTPRYEPLVSWIGMDIREYSSGGKHNRFGMTKHGNRYLRTAFIEANQRGYRTARISKDLKARRKNTDPGIINIADRCLRRLNKKGNRLLLAGKHPNKVKVACAREMVGFVWESLHKAAA
jgi:hypothetical protein